MIFIVSDWRTKYWNEDYHVFWSSVGWDPESQCSPIRNGETTVHRSCCGPESTGPFQLYNEQTHQCCTDFSIESIGSCWKIWNKSKIARNYCLSISFIKLGCLTLTLSVWPLCGQTALKSILWGTLFLDQLLDFSLLS